MAVEQEGKDDSIRGLLGEAFDEHEGNNEELDGSNVPDNNTAASTTDDKGNADDKAGAEADADKTADKKAKDKDSEDPDEGGEAKAKPKVEKGPDGKFRKGPDGKFQKAVDPNAPKDGTETKKEEDQAQLPKSKAPGSWKPSAREKWNGLPAEIQQEVLRRERDIATGFNEVAEIKKFRDQFGGVVTQHQGIINAEGGDAMKMTRDLYTTAGILYNGTPQQKVATVASFIRNFGVDIAMLDQYLSDPNAAPPRQQPATGGNQDAASFIRAEIQAAMAPLINQQQKEVGQSIEEFAADPANEFFEDVKDTMADLLEVSAKRGKQMNLQEAYGRAILMHSEIAEVVEDRKLRERTQQRSTAASQARKRSVSLKSTPSKELATGDPATEKSGGGLRNDILSAVDALSD